MYTRLWPRKAAGLAFSNAFRDPDGTAAADLDDLADGLVEGRLGGLVGQRHVVVFQLVVAKLFDHVQQFAVGHRVLHQLTDLRVVVVGDHRLHRRRAGHRHFRSQQRRS